MPGSSLRRRADLVFIGWLAVVSTCVVAGVALWTRGTSCQLAVERRLGSIARLARQNGLPLAPLVAVLIAEAHRHPTRPDETVATQLAAALGRHGGETAVAVRSLFADSVEAAMTLDLLERHRERWRRLYVASNGRDQ